MMYSLLIAASLIGLAIVIALAAYAWLRDARPSGSAREEARERAQREAAGILAQAHDEERRLLAEAEAASIRLARDREAGSAEAQRAYDARLEALFTKLEAQLAAAGDAAAAAMQHASERSLALLGAAADRAQSQLEESLAALGKETAAHIDGEVARAFETAREEAARYERARKQAVDEHIAELVGETAKRALGRLPESVTVELIERSLEEAESDHVF